MNKKFSTFLTGVALFGAVASVFAQDDGSQSESTTPIRWSDNEKHSITAAQDITSLKEGQNEGFYQLAVNDGVLALTESGQLVVVDDSTLLDPTDTSGVATVPFGNTLWCVIVSNENQSQTPKYDFLNKGTGMYLDVHIDEAIEALEEGYPSEPIVVGGEIGGWSLSAQYLEGLTSGTMYSSFKTDSVIGLVVNSDNNTVSVEKAGFNSAVEKGVDDYSEFTLQAAAARYLDANDINTVIGTQEADQGVTLKFNPDAIGTDLENPFNAQKFKTVDAEDNYVNVYREADGKTLYLRVDTAYTNNDTGATKFLKFAWTEGIDTVDTVLAKQYNFLFTYEPTYDNIYIQVEEIRVKEDNNEPYWNDSLLVFTNQYVSVQDLIGNNSIIILSIEVEQNTTIAFGLETCSPPSSSNPDATSIASDLYLIKQGNKYLAVPLYGDSTVQWVTIDENVEPWQMPAFQWVVEKTQTTTDEAAVSPLKITNREFGFEYATALQLYNNSGNFSVSDFIADPANYKADPYLGYRKFDSDSIRITSYQLKYLHGLSGDNDAYVGSESTLRITTESKGIFALDTLLNGTDATVEEYGYKGNVTGIVQLKRQAYRLKQKNTSNSYIRHNDENRYVVSSDNNLSQPSVFLFKANNYKEDLNTIYYALIDTLGYYGVAPDSLRKVGVNDNLLLLEAEEMTEKRTSAFAIEIDDTPIYRRFGTDPADDAPDTDESVAMRFYEKYRNEYLQVESNENFNPNPGILDYLGIDRADQVPSELLVFTVDTAWVERGLGYIKPQYLISIDRRDYAGRDIKPCDEDYHGFAPDGTPYDKYTCPHAIPGAPAFERGKYLVNLNEVYKNYTTEDVVWRNRYDRVGFVHAIRIQDSLYVLNNNVYDFSEFDNETIDIDAIKAEAAKSSNSRNVKYYPLSGDDHKYVTWSMRYEDINNIDTNNSFLIESMSEDNSTWIQPTKAQWLKMNNGCLVLSVAEESNFDEMTGLSTNDDALIFNVIYAADAADDEFATDNDKVTTTEVKVIASEGKVTILNATGKKVVVNNILGQTIANTVLSSDNASIAAPKGIVVVAVEGEEAVKAIVK